MDNLTGTKTVLVTGGTKGIGKEIALYFLQLGYEVVINYSSDEEAALSTQSEFNMLGYCPVLLRADVSDEKQVCDMFREFFSLYDRLDVLINNAGISFYEVIQDTTLADWERVFAVNMTGAFLCCREVADKMVGAGGGCIINISSVWGEVGASCEVAYSASKAALIGFTKALSKELAPSNVRVNCVSPGVIDTSMNERFTSEEIEDLIYRIPMGRLGTGADVAKACAYLADADYVTGEVLPVGGGFAK
ncbi:MAG: 3-oxoacyl-ACP reductase FabG [Clostridia bacterium]|nr:3-oxoacyl-ACP reductase FabG [Clostridia bacterium]MCD8308734.1 3-oxoacyl-ACP reductase FabG [Clostridia bacterium]